MNIVDTLNTVIDTTKTVVDSTAVNNAINTVTQNSGIFEDKGMVQAAVVIGGIMLILIGILVWDFIEDREK
jgi:hypothetical protein